MAKFDDYGDKKNEARDAKLYYANKICAVPMCNNAGVAKNNNTGEGQWYCKYHVIDVNSDAIREDGEKDWRIKKIADQRKEHPERERQPGESRHEFAIRSIQFMREKSGMIGSG